MAIILARPISTYQLSCSNCKHDIIPKIQQDLWKDEKDNLNYSNTWFICPNCKIEFENTPENPKFLIPDTMDCESK